MGWFSWWHAEALCGPQFSWAPSLQHLWGARGLRAILLGHVDDKPFAPRVRCFSYVDNWELVSTDAECLLRANRSILEFARLLDLTLDTSKTVAWSTDRGIRRQLRQSGFTVSLPGRDLGAHVVYSRQIRNQTIQLRISDLQDFWNKLRGAFGAYKQKVRVVVTAAWPRIFHGISASVLGLKHFAELRTEFMRAVDAARPQASPYLHMILEGLHLDPQPQ